MNFRKAILRTVSVVLSSFGLLLSLLAIFIRKLIPSQRGSKPPPDAGENSQRTIALRVKRPVPGPVASSTSSSLRSTRSNNIMHSSVVDEAVSQIHASVDLPTSPMPATELPIQRSHRGGVLKAHNIFKRHTLSVSPSFDACRMMASSKQRSTHLKNRNSMGSFSCPLKNPDPPLRTQPYAAPYFFPAPGSPEAIDYVTKTREELLQTSGFMHTNAFTLKRNKRS